MKCFANLNARGPEQRVALLLAGGDGKRLQELTCQIAGSPIPKQYCRLLHGCSLLEATLSRAKLFTSPDRICAVVNRDHLKLARDQLRALPEDNILIQPRNRDTGPGLVFALLHLAQIYPDATVALFPTDHYVDDDEAFIAHVLHASNLISRFPEKIAVLGIAPNRPETGYGYILPAQPVQTTKIQGRIFHVDAFHEKPSTTKARFLIARGGLWNTFVMVFKLSRMLDLLRDLIPVQSKGLFELNGSPCETAEFYDTLDPWNFSTHVLAVIPSHLIVFEVADVYWSDWGTRESVERTYRTLSLVPSWQPMRKASQ